MNTEKIKNIREELEITQKDISRVLGCTRTAYSLWEINKNTIPLYYLNKISNEYNINIDYLVDLSNDKYIKFDKVEIDRINLGKKLKEARKHKYKVVVSSLQTNNSVYDIDYKKKLIVIGNEANGVSKEIQELSDTKIIIPMLGKTESLNASVATGVVLYEYVRQKICK